MNEATATLTFEVLTLFPDAVRSFVQAGLLGKAIEKGLVQVHCTDIRDFATDRHRTVDDTPFGGGAGMVLKPEPVVAAVESVEAQRGPMHRVLLTPSAPRFDQRAAQRLASQRRIALLCGRYGGIDDRVREHFVHECLSLGDFILGGGEVAALAIIEAVSRLTEGVLGNPDSLSGESFEHGPHGQLLEHPNYTRPAEFRGHRVPDVLLGGDHAAIAAWRARAALARTWSVRPELRPAARLPPNTPIHVALSDDVAADALWLPVLRDHGVASLVIVGGSEAMKAWAEALQGRVPLAAFGSPAALRRRLRTRNKTRPWIVAVCAPTEDAARPTGTDSFTAFTDTRQLVDALQVRAPLQRPVLVLWPIEDPHAAAQAQASGSVDALFAPSMLREEPGTKHASTLETGPQITDPSRPPTRLAALVDRALTHLQSCQ